MKKTTQKSSEKELWFKAKTYGWGWYPSTWQGWVLTILALVSIIYHATLMEKYPWRSGILILFVVLVLLAACFLKGEKPRWRWGD